MINKYKKIVNKIGSSSIVNSKTKKINAKWMKKLCEDIKKYHKEKKIIKDAIIEMGAEVENIDKIIQDAEEKEKDTNQILDFTREIKNVNEEDKKIIIEALWDIIYSDEDADMYETNLMRRLSGLLYLDPKVVGDIKVKVRSKQ